MDDIMQKAENIGNRFNQIEKQFTDYDKAMTDYKDFMEDVLANRAKVREEGVSTNPANQEQKEIMKNLDEISAQLKEYSKVMKSNHLVDQIKTY